MNCASQVPFCYGHYSLGRSLGSQDDVLVATRGEGRGLGDIMVAAVIPLLCKVTCMYESLGMRV